MVKSRFPGKPSKCFGRRSVSGVNSAEADELKSAEDCYLRLTLFNYLFKTDDEDKSFHGFSPHDENKKSNKSTFDKSKKRKIKASTSDKKTEPFDKCNKPDVSDTNETSNKPDIELKQPETSTASDKSESKTANIQSNTTFSGKFVLPSRSNHSSRVIKPNKRFLEGETSSLPSKKVHLNSSVKPSAVQCVPSSSEVVEPERSSTPVQQPSKGRPPKRKSELCGGLAKKFVLRKPRLKIKTLPLPSVGGPFSSSAGNSLSLQGANQSPGAIKVFCGVCGALRTFKFLHHARKFGIFSCLPCRKFILKIIRSERKNALSSLECVSGNGNCSIRQNSLASQCFVNDVTKEKSPVESDRCEACWLNLCLQSFHMPHKLVKRLTTFLPEKLQKSMKLSKSVAISKNDVISDTTENSGNEIKFIKRNRVPKETINSRRGLSSHNLRGQSSSGDTSKKGRSRLHKFPAAGPRVKHVCRSASLVLRQPVATFDNQPLETDDAAPLIQENDILEEAASTAPENQEEEITPLPTTDIIVKNTQENEPPPVINRINFPPVARMLQDLGRANNELLDGMENHEQAKLNARVSIDFWESYDPDEVSRMGFPLIGFQPLRLRAVCFLCGSAGLEKLIHCGNCCEPYHPFCVSSKLPAEPSGDWWRLDWLCPKCTVCVACSRTGGTQLSCCKCSRNYHSACITSARFNIYDSNWVCPSCLFCKSCNGSSVYVFIGNMPLCKSCFKLRKKGSFCPLCQCCYDDNDYSTKMMECAVCKCWIHAQCEGLSNEKYQVLSYLPSTIEFICRLCCKNPPPPWSHAVEAELKAGYLNVIKILSKNKTACQAFKSSPKKQRVCVCSSNQTSPIHLNDLMNNSVSEVLSIDSPPDTSIDQEIKSSDLGLLTPKLTKDDEESLKIVKSDFLNLVSDKNDCKFSEELPKVNDSVPSSENTQLLKIAYEERAEKFEKPNLIDNTVTAKEKTEQSSVRLCSCQKPDPAAPQSLSLLSIKNKATLDEYHSVLEFHNDMVLVTKEIGNEELIETYNRCLKQIFPWFEPGLDDTVLGSPIANTSPVGANQIVENPKDETEEAKRKWSGLESLLNLDQASYYIGMDFQETRFCVLCKCVGEGIPRREGRLLYCGRNEWVHTNCALWSSEVFEEIDGSLQNVHSAVSRARLIRCQHCGKKGASLGCCAKSCPLAFHFGCALSAECVFLENKELYCKSHASYQGTREKQKEEDFFVKRSVYVELDNKKSKDVFRSLVKVYIGSLEVSHLGEVLPDLSDHPDVIVPCEYWCSRLFWSCKEPWKIVRYTIKTKVTNLTDEFDVCNDMNYTVDHSLEFTPPPSPADSLMGGKYSPDAGERDIKAMINQIIETICTKEDESDHQSTDLLPPELSDVIFDDLPKDFLDRVTVHDIFTKMNFDDYLFSETKEDKQENNYISSNAEPVGNKARVVNVKPTLRHEKVSKSIGAAKQKGYEKIKECRVTLDREPVNRWKRKQSLLQLDGAADYSESDQSNDASDVDMSHTTENSDFTEDKPVKCARCHRTYRTRQSYERHLETCSSDVLSCSESDLSEEEKSEGFPDGELKPSDSSESQVFVPVSMEVNSSVSNENNIQTIIENQSNKSVVCINGMNFEQNCEERMSISPVGTSLNNESLTDSSFQAGQTVVTPPVETLIQDKVVNLQHPTIILQSMPTENIMSSIIQPSFHQETAQPSIQYIINDQEKNHFLHNSNGATTYHIQPQMSQPLVQNLPAVVATVVQANGVEQLVLNNSGPNIEMYGQQQSGMFFANQPMIVGMETVVSNTVMQSSRFIGGTPGVLASSYSATTTQVFQAAKPVIEIPQSYVFVNSNPLMISSNDAQRILSNGPAPTQNPSWNGFKINTLDSTKFEKVSTHQSLPLSIEKKEAPNGFASFNQIGAVPTVSEHLNGSLQLKEIGNFNKHHSVHHSNFVNKMPSSIKAVELPLSSAIHKEKPQQAVAPVVIKRVVEPLKYNKLNCETKVEEKKIDLTEKFSPTLHKKVNPPAIPFKETNSGALMELKDSPSNKVEEKEIISNEVDSKPISCNILPPKILKDHKKIEPKINGHESFKKKNHFIEEPKIAFEISSEDGFHFNTTSLEEAWTKVYETVQSARQAKNLPPLNENPFATPDIMLKKLMGLGNNCMKYLVEQLPGISTCSKYKPTYHNKEPSALERELFCGKRINPSGCARTEQYEHQRKRYDMFSWLASRHRRPPKLLPPEAETSNGNSRRATSINLPMAMRFRHLKDTSKTSVGVFRSDIHGRGLFCLRDIDAGEMVIEYAGEVIRSALTDKRERYYTEKGIGCYMFRIDDKFVVDATMKGNAARFINHSCEPNCYSRVLDILGKKHILIFALRKIHQGEELTYDYKFPLEEDKINCHCLSRKCRKYLN